MPMKEILKVELAEFLVRSQLDKKQTIPKLPQIDLSAQLQNTYQDIIYYSITSFLGRIYQLRYLQKLLLRWQRFPKVLGVDGLLN